MQLAEHPDLLAGYQIDEEAPRRWLLLQRELGNFSHSVVDSPPQVRPVSATNAGDKPS